MTEKQKVFCIEYLKDFNGTEAYLRAYPGVTRRTANVNAARLLASEPISKYLASEREKLLKKVRLEAEDVLRDLIKVKDACMAPIDILAWDSEAHNMEPTGQTKMADPKSANQALELLGKYLGMFKDQNGVNVTSQVVILDDIPKEGSPNGKTD